MTTAVSRPVVRAEPIVVQELFGGLATVYLFGKPTSWRLCESGELIRGFVESLGSVNRVFAPNPTRFNAQIVLPGDFPQNTPLRKLFQGLHADGVFGLEIGDAAYFSSADCPMVVLFVDGYLAVFHAGRDSLLVRYWISRFAEMRNRTSVAANTIYEFRTRGVDPHCLRAHILCGIDGRHFDHSPNHPKYGRDNDHLVGELRDRGWDRAIVELEDDKVGLSLHGLITDQLVQAGVREESIISDGLDTYSNPQLWSTVEMDEQRIPRARHGRNGVLVVRNR